MQENKVEEPKIVTKELKETKVSDNQQTGQILFVFPNGDDVSYTEYKEALNQYGKRDKGQRFVVMGINTSFMQYSTIKRVA